MYLHDKYSTIYSRDSILDTSMVLNSKYFEHIRNHVMKDLNVIIYFISDISF